MSMPVERPPGLRLTRAQLIGPVGCTLIGAAGGVCWAMLYREYEGEHGRVFLEDSLPAVFLGAAAGVLVGLLVSAVCRRRPSVIPAVTLVVTTLLGAAIAAPAGWIAGDRWRGIERDPPRGMALGASLGAAGGLVVGIVQLLSDRKRRLAERDALTQPRRS
jgi:drug/metabolite transporter (DMT)-like permease